MWWLGKTLGVDRWLLLVVAVVLLAGVYGWLVAREAADDRRNQEIGRKAEREKQLETIIERTETAHEAREDMEQDLVAGGSERLYAQCLRTARTPANCERFLPVGQAAER